MIMDLINLFVLTAGVAVAVWAIRSHRSTSAKRAALEFVSQFEIHAGPEWPNTVRLATQAIDNREVWLPLVSYRPGTDTLTEEQARQRAALFTWLNHYEAVATAIDLGALDREFYIRLFGFPYKKFWPRASACVHAYRETSGDPTAFEEFQRLAKSISQ